MSAWNWADLGKERGRHAFELSDGSEALVYHAAYWKPKQKVKALIAAAPELLAGLEHVGFAGHRFGSVEALGCSQCNEALDAIRSARGGK